MWYAIGLLGTLGLMHKLYEESLKNDERVKALRARLMPFFPELSATEMYKGRSSYTRDKKHIYLCLGDDKMSYETNIMTYVLLHELAHVLCDEVGHTEKFSFVFRGLLERAYRHQLLRRDMPINRDYCLKERSSSKKIKQ